MRLVLEVCQSTFPYNSSSGHKQFTAGLPMRREAARFFSPEMQVRAPLLHGENRIVFIILYCEADACSGTTFVAGIPVLVLIV